MGLVTWPTEFRPIHVFVCLLKAHLGVAEVV